MKNPFRRKKVAKEQPVLTPKEQLEKAQLDMATSKKRYARTFDRLTKSTNRAHTLFGILTVFGVSVGLVILGTDLEAGNWKYALLDLIFVIMFGSLALGRFLDIRQEARNGRDLRDKLVDALEKVEELKTKKLTNSLKDIFGSKEDAQHIHSHILRDMLDKTIHDVLGKDYKDNESPTSEQLKEIRESFRELTGHTAEIKWNETDHGFDVKINESHDDHSHNNGKKSTAKKNK